MRQKTLMPTLINGSQKFQLRQYPATSFINCGAERSKRRTPVNRISLPTCGLPSRR